MGAAAATSENGMSLVARCNAYCAANKLSRADFAKLVNFSRSAVSQYLNGKYNSNPANVEAAIRRFFSSIGAMEPEEATTVKRLPLSLNTADHSQTLIKSGDFRSVFGVCRACQDDQLIGVVTGQSGYGKTYSLKQYAKLPHVVYIASNVFWGPRNMVKRIVQALGIAPPKAGNVDDNLEAIVGFFEANPGYLLIIDEADKLISKYAAQKLYMLQTIFDNAPVGIVLAGLPKLGQQLASYLPEVENRAIYGCELRGLNADEVNDYLSQYDIEPRVLEQLHNRAYGKRKSCFRLLAHTVKAVLKESRQNTVTMEIYTRATENMLIR
jgi:DNA transposition AAA+ family ATPase